MSVTRPARHLLVSWRCFYDSLIRKPHIVSCGRALVLAIRDIPIFAVGAEQTAFKEQFDKKPYLLRAGHGAGHAGQPIFDFEQLAALIAGYVSSAAGYSAASAFRNGRGLKCVICGESGHDHRTCKAGLSAPTRSGPPPTTANSTQSTSDEANDVACEAPTTHRAAAHARE